MSIECFQIVLCLSVLVMCFSLYRSLHGFVTAWLLLVPFTWPYIPYLGSIYH